MLHSSIGCIRAFYDLDVEVDFVFPDTPEFTGYRLLVVPALYVSR